MCRASIVLCALAAAACVQGADVRGPDVRYEPTPMDVVEQMLELAAVKADDVVFDLGCGDGRIVVTAARRYGARGVCVDIDPQRIAEARENARAAGVSNRISFRQEDLMSTQLGEASVVMLFLSNDLNLKLRPRLECMLKPGTRVVSHWHAMGNWKPERTIVAQSEMRERPIYLWIVARRASSCSASRVRSSRRSTSRERERGLGMPSLSAALTRASSPSTSCSRRSRPWSSRPRS
jgi:tRNA A58 N-methylase Trm61